MLEMNTKLLEKFLEEEISSQELYDAIYHFITSYDIRNGEFECNYFIVKKMDRDNAFIFSEHIYPKDNHREIPACFSIYINHLVEKLTHMLKVKVTILMVGKIYNGRDNEANI